jgi:hypothetical protein
MNYKKIISALVFSNVFMQAGVPEREPFFKNPIIQKLDCMKIGSVTIGIDGKTIHDVLWLISEIRIIQTGVKDSKNKIIEKRYQFNNEWCALHDLVVQEELIEQRLAQEYQLLKEQYQEDSLMLKKAVTTVDSAYAAQKQELNTALDHAKQDFIKKTEIFVQQIRLFKELVVQLIDEWAQRRNRPDSFLKKWGSIIKDEHEYFFAHLTQCKDVDIFLSDLKTFLIDLVYSCPKGIQEFKEKYAIKK